MLGRGLVYLFALIVFIFIVHLTLDKLYSIATVAPDHIFILFNQLIKKRLFQLFELFLTNYCSYFEDV